jgi:nitrate/nitrite-specific signal transduction histidine kinase
VNRTRKKTTSGTRSNRLLARKVHDDISQKLTVLGLELAVLQATLPSGNKLAPKINQLSQLTTEVAKSVREVMEVLSAKNK